jgi:dihydrofolate reductase
MKVQAVSMNKPTTIIVAVDHEGGFGKDGKIPWYLPEDLQRFKAMTTGHVCVMGRRTYEEILDARKVRDSNPCGQHYLINEILRGRDSFVVSSRDDFETPGATKVRDIAQVYNIIGQDDKRKVFVIGGRRMFIEALSISNEILMTVVKGDSYKCDVKIPIDVLNKKWKIVSGEETDKAYFVVYNRK